jgi:uncharacterized OB-fold protein
VKCDPRPEVDAILGFERFGLVSYTSQTRVSTFIDYLEQGKICGTKCKECGCVQFPPRSHCVRCFSTNFEWKELAGDCELITYTKVDAAPSKFKDEAPYLLGIAEFPEGSKVFARIEKEILENELGVGMKLKLSVTKLANGNLSYLLRRSSSP